MKLDEKTTDDIPENKDKEDIINHPSHYNNSKGIETIDVIEAFTEDLSGIQAVCTANALKYVCRWHKKNGVEDINKAIWYLNKLKETIGDDGDDEDTYMTSLRDTLMRHFIDEQRPMVVHTCGIEDFVKYLFAYGFYINGKSEDVCARYYIRISKDNLGEDLVFVPNGKNISAGLASDFEAVWGKTDNKKPLYWS